MVLTKFGPGGEVLRRAAITYEISGGDPSELGFQISTDYNGLMVLVSKEGKIYAVGESLTIGHIHIVRKLGGTQQKDLEGGSKQTNEAGRKNKTSNRKISDKHR